MWKTVLPCLLFLLAACNSAPSSHQALAGGPAGALAESPSAREPSSLTASEVTSAAPLASVSAEAAASASPPRQGGSVAAARPVTSVPEPRQGASAPGPSSAVKGATSAPADAHAGHDHEPVPTAAPGAAAPGNGEVDALYTCPMHPAVTAGAPGRCPECGMNLVPKKP